MDGYLGSPVIANEQLPFCGEVYKKGTRLCCDSTKDSQLQMQFEALNISSYPQCASAIKSILCAVYICFPYLSIYLHFY